MLFDGEERIALIILDVFKNISNIALCFGTQSGASYSVFIGTLLPLAKTLQLQLKQNIC